MRVIPDLDLDRPANRRLRNDAIAGADSLLRPTRADCTSVAFCEAASRRWFENVLSGDAWGGSMRGILEDVVACSR